MDQQKFRAVRKEVLIQYVFLLSILRSTNWLVFRGVLCPSNWLTITGSCTWINVTYELQILSLAVLLLVLELIWERDWKGFIQTCRSNWLVLGFVGLVGLSLFWSIQVNITLYKFTILLVYTSMAIYLGHIFRLEKLIRSMSWFFVGICLVSLFFVFFLPDYGILTNPFYSGAWSGMFIHRNYLGCFMALGMTIFLINLLSIKKPRRKYFYFNFLMLLVTLFLLIMSKSATGIITSFVLIILTLAIFAWINWGQLLKPIHYIGIICGVLILFIFVMSKLDFIFGMLGKDLSLTGRVPMWKYLFQHVINQRPWLGYGYGVIWHLLGFIRDLTSTVNWGTPVEHGENGFIDILLHLGIVGVISLIILITVGFIRAVRNFLQERTMIAAFPILVLVFGMVANISLSLILETETLVWIITVATLVSINNKAQDRNLAPLNHVKE